MRSAVSAVLILLCIGGALQDASAGALPERIGERLRFRMESPGEPGPVYTNKGCLFFPATLSGFYQGRRFQPVWMDESGPALRADTLIRAIRDSSQDGLNPRDYHLAAIESLLEGARKERKANRPYMEKLADLELLLTDALLLQAYHRMCGRVDPENGDPEWHADRRGANLSSWLRSRFDPDRIPESLSALVPDHPDYKGLRDALAFYRDLLKKGGWPRIHPVQTIRKGDRGELVGKLRDRLAVTGEWAKVPADPDLFDEALEEAVVLFQSRNGLKPDGVVGPGTWTFLNLTPWDRIEQIKANLERWRWLPRKLGDRYILVNIADYRLEVVENEKPVMNMRAIVGMPTRRTPAFSARISYMVLNPSWNVPQHIAEEDILPRVKKNPGYLKDQKIRVLQGWGEEMREVDPASVPWREVSSGRFPYRLRQEPGPANALGRVKFMFPNRFNVYIHDTPSRDLFDKTGRTLSSGCIRIEKPMELMEYLLKNNSQWSSDRIQETLQAGAEKTVGIPEPIQVHMLYWTAWMEPGGTIQFRPDIYDRDRRLIRAMNRKLSCTPDPVSAPLQISHR